jgi:hypothetical protein
MTPKESTTPNPAPSSGPIAPTATNYPKYFIEFTGLDIGRIPVTGPHTFSLVAPPGGSIKVELTRNPTDPGGPNLSVTFSKG